MYRILVIDDDLSILRLIRNILNLSKYEVVTHQKITDINLCDFIGYDLILLDIMMPISGLDVCEAIRKEIDTPILFITAKNMENDVVKGINAGADDYIVKPFSVNELLARVKMHLRREERIRGKREKLKFCDIVIDIEERRVFVKNEALELTKREYFIVYLLASNPNRIFTVEEIYERVYPQESNTQFHSVAEYIYQIRTKFKAFGVNPIKTMWGGGYQWREEKISTD